MAEKDADRYVDLMLYDMGDSGEETVTIRASVPLQPLVHPVSDEEQQTILADFPAVFRRLKQLSNLEPDTTGVIAGTIEMRVTTRWEMIIRSEFDDTCDDPCCKLTLVEKRTYNQCVVRTG